MEPYQYRVLEIYYDAEDVELRDYVELGVEMTLLSSLPRDVVESYIWPRVIEGPTLPRIQNMVRVSRVCKAWREWVSQSEDWVEAKHSYFESFLPTKRCWWRPLSRTTAA
jgi:hypothetical protein